MFRLPFLVQNLNFHDQFANALVGLIKLLDDRGGLPFLEPGVDAGQRSSLLYRHPRLARDGIEQLAAQQAQHDFLLAPRRAPLHLGDRAVLASSRATRSFRQAQGNRI